MSEFAYINWLRQQSQAHANVLVGPGDDTAVVKPLPHPLLITTDMLVDGTHFILSEIDPRQIGRKAMAVNLSDIAAMAGIPSYAVVSIALPDDGGIDLAKALYHGMRDMADEFDTAIVGGDTNSGKVQLAISVTVIGEATDNGAVLRSGAKPGDWLIVTGSLGGSLAGRHLNFKPRVREALALHNAAALHAMIDVSDGLAADVWHLCEESKCGAVLRANTIPISANAYKIADERTPLEHALHDGEDFELVFAISAEDGQRLVEVQPIADVILTCIGEMIEERELYLEQESKREKLSPLGFVHRLS